MKLLWLDLNSSYAHSSLALPALHAQIANNTDIEYSGQHIEHDCPTDISLVRRHKAPHQL